LPSPSLNDSQGGNTRADTIPPVADARQVLEEAVNEAALLARTGGSLEELQRLVLLARTALHAEDGQVDDETMREGGLSPGAFQRLGLA
jgi:hypothetical protein